MTVTDEVDDFEADFEHDLKQYYNKLFPFQDMYSWLSVNFVNREFSFTLQSESYLR